MELQQATDSSWDGVAIRTDAKGQAWRHNYSEGGSINRIDGRVLPINTELCETLKDWNPRDPKREIKRIWPCACVDKDCDGICETEN